MRGQRVHEFLSLCGNGPEFGTKLLIFEEMSALTSESTLLCSTVHLASTSILSFEAHSLLLSYMPITRRAQT